MFSLVRLGFYLRPTGSSGGTHFLTDWDPRSSWNPADLDMHELQSSRQQQVLPDLSSTWRYLTIVTAITAGFGRIQRPQSRQNTRVPTPIRGAGASWLQRHCKNGNQPLRETDGGVLGDVQAVTRLCHPCVDFFARMAGPRHGWGEVDILASAKCHSVTAPDNATQTTRTTTACDNQFPVNTNGGEPEVGTRGEAELRGMESPRRSFVTSD